jgi:molybdate/tungstate transport system ATP-binding protein
MLEIRNLGLKKGNFSLREISFSVPKDGYFALLGPTGSGKTLLIEAIAGFHSMTGALLLNGSDITRLPPEKRKFGFVFQDFALFPHLNVEANIRYGGRFLKKDCAPASIDELTGYLGIAQLLKRDVNSLSAGERQRTAIARALYPRPQLLLLDEPLGALDPATRENILPKLAELPARFGTPVIHVTHNFEIAERISGSAGILLDGCLRRCGHTADVLSSSEDSDIARFLQPRKNRTQPLCGGAS